MTPALAKSDRTTGTTRTLVGHSLDVAVAALRLLEKPTIRSRLSAAAGMQLDETHVARLAVLSGLHDCGKAVVGFQRRITGESHGTSHLAEALAALMTEPKVQEALRIPLISEWFSDPSAALFCSICHHGGPVSRQDIENALADVPWQVATSPTYDPITELQVLIHALFSRFPAAFGSAPVIPWTVSLDHLMAGVVMLADWLGSSCPVPGDDWRPEEIDGLLETLPWTNWHSGKSPSSILPGPPIGAQAAITEVPVSDRLVIVEAPTGTGKTETALMRALQLVEAGEVDGLYFALPSRAAATEIHGRISNLVRRHSPAIGGRVVRAVPGLLDVDNWQNTQTASWAIASPKRTLTAPIAVGTIDQAMLAALRTRHAWMRHAALSRNLLVIDEVHASDPYMLEIVRSLVRRQLDVGGHALLMSATLGEVLRAELEQRRRLRLDDALASPYPAVSSGSGVRGITSPATASNLSVLSYRQAVAQASETVQSGGCSLIIRSTVDSARATYGEFVSAGLPALLHHSRYADEDRQHLDAKLLGIIGKSGSRMPMAIVATQTAEQSLDIDADLLVSDPAPADVLLQRRGRLGRHRPHQTFPFIVIEPSSVDSTVVAALRKAQGKAARMPTGSEWAYVYDPLATLATVEALKEMKSVRVPQDVRRLVEIATHPESLQAFAGRQGWSALWQTTWGARLAMRQQATGGLLDWSSPYADQLVTEVVPTRLGEGSLSVALSGSIRSPFTGMPIQRIPVPWSWLVGQEPNTLGRPTMDETGWVIQIGEVAVRYDKLGVARIRSSHVT